MIHDPSFRSFISALNASLNPKLRQFGPRGSPHWGWPVEHPHSHLGGRSPGVENVLGSQWDHQMDEMGITVKNHQILWQSIENVKILWLMDCHKTTRKLPFNVNLNPFNPCNVNLI